MIGHKHASSSVNPLSYFNHGAERLADLALANGFDNELESIVDVFSMMTEGWGARPIGPGAGDWRSDVADDHTPYEFSVVYRNGDPELRVLVEAQHETPSLLNNWHAGLALSRHLAERFGLSLRRHDAVLDLFAPGSDARMGIWHAVSFRPGKAPDFKVYFDGQSKGRWRAPAVIEEALVRLDFGKAWPVVRSVGPRGLRFDELKYFSLDLSDSPHARVKVYWRHHHAAASELGRLLTRIGAPEAEVTEFCRAIGGGEGPYATRPVFSCTSLTDPSSDRAQGWTVYVPIAAYASNDAVAVKRIGEAIVDAGLDPARYEATIQQYAPRSLTTTSSLQSYVSLSHRKGQRQVTVYLCPEAHRVAQAKPELVTREPEPAVPSAEAIVHRYEHDIVLADHPLLQRFGREPVNLGHLWLVMANFWEAIVHDFPARLSRVIARFEDDHWRCIFVKQLNDELGEGDYTRAHKAMFRRMLDALEPYRMPGDEARLLAPGREFGRRLGEHLFDGDVHEAIGTLMMIEIYGKQVDVHLGAEFRRQHALDPNALQWLNLHEELEVDHADDSLTVARLMPEPGRDPDSDRRLASVWRGADGVADASMAYFDALYAICYG